MSYSIQWSEKAKEHLAEVVVARTKRAGNPPNTERATRTVAEELSLYPRRADAQPGEHVIGELPIFGLRIFYDIDLDADVVVVTDVAANQWVI
jgi:hypothetical protein